MFTPQLLLIGLVVLLLTLYLPALVCPKKFHKEIKNIASDANLIRTWGMLIMLISLFFLSISWKIDQSWMTLISVIGWLALIKGIVFIWFPGTIKKIVKTFYGSNEKVILMSIIGILVALALCYITLNLFQMGELVSG